MVRRIDGKKGSVSGSSPVDSARGVEGAKLTGVTEVGATQGKPATGKVKRSSTRPMNAEEREQLLRLVKEEADKLFADGAMPKSQRKKVEGAVKMAIESCVVEEEEK